MDARFYNSEEIDIEKLANNLVSIYQAQGFQAQNVGSSDQMMVQLKKGGDLEALIGLQAALTVTIQRSGGGVLAMIGQQKWIDKAAVGAVGIVLPILWPLMITAGAGAIRQASLGNKVLNTVDGLVRQQLPEIQIGPVPVQMMPQMQQQWAPPPPQYMPPQYMPPPPQVFVPVQPMPPPQVFVPVQPMPPTYVPSQPPRQAPMPPKLRCPSCNTPYEAGDTFCTGCGKSLVTLCPTCKTEIKDNSSFCPKCGSSTFQALNPTQVSQPVPPTVPSKSTVTYTAPPPARPQTPASTPPPVSDVPVYTPPPVKPQAPPPAKPKVQQAPPMPVYTPPPAPEPYVPPTPQEPAVMPKPTVTFVPAPKQDKPAAPKPPAQPQVPYYTPPVNPQPVAPKAKPGHPQGDVPPLSQPIVSKPAAQPAFDPTATWGYLLFNDGKQVTLSGESALVGRSDHDVIDMQPQVDLSTATGSDTVSRIHATIEHIGSAFTLTDLNSTNLTRINGKRLEPDKATPINDGDTLTFGKASCTFKKV